MKFVIKNQPDPESERPVEISLKYGDDPKEVQVCANGSFIFTLDNEGRLRLARLTDSERALGFKVDEKGDIETY